MFRTAVTNPHLIREEGAPIRSIATVSLRRANCSFTLVNATLEFSRRSDSSPGALIVVHEGVMQETGNVALLASLPISDLQLVGASGDIVRYSGWLSSAPRFYPADLPDYLSFDPATAGRGGIFGGPPEVEGENMPWPAPVMVTMTTGTPNPSYIAATVDLLARQLAAAAS